MSKKAEGNENNESPPQPLDNSDDSNADDPWDEWQPMTADFRSVQNLLRVDQNDPLGYNLAVGGSRVTTLEETPCRFYTGRGDFCWKGPQCPYKHERGKHTVLSNFIDVGKETCRTLGSMDEKPLVIRGGIVPVTITHVESPSEFYVMPEGNWQCLCEKYSSENKQFARKCAHSSSVDEHGVVSFGFDEEELQLKKMKEKQAELEAYEKLITYGKFMYDKLMVGLNSYLCECMTWRRLQTTVYEILELVAVRIDNLGGTPIARKKIWTRGVIFQTDIRNATDRDVPWFTVQLIDQGPTLDVSAEDLCRLPPAFCATPGLVQRCCLDGVVPVRYRWNKSSVEKFKELSMSKPLWLTVKMTPLEIRPNLLDRKVLNKEVPYVVALTFQEENGKKRASVAQKMADAGKAVALNIFPFRPQITQVMKTLDSWFPFLSQTSCSKPLPRETFTAEIGRMYRNRKFITEDDVDSKFKLETGNRKEDQKTFSKSTGKTLPASTVEVKSKRVKKKKKKKVKDDSQTMTLPEALNCVVNDSIGSKHTGLPKNLGKSGINSGNGIHVQTLVESDLDKISKRPASCVEYSLCKESATSNDGDATLAEVVMPSSSVGLLKGVRGLRKGNLYFVPEFPSSDSISFAGSARLDRRKHLYLQNEPLKPLPSDFGRNPAFSMFDDVYKMFQSNTEGADSAGLGRLENYRSNNTDPNSRVREWVENELTMEKYSGIKKKTKKKEKWLHS